jgi:hypothetical protein
MAIGNLEIRMAHLEGAYEQINERLGALDQYIRELQNDVAGIRTDVAGVRADVAGMRADVAGGQARLVSVFADGVTRTNDLRKELLSRMDRQFFWLLGLLSVSIFLPIARSLGR